MAVPHPPSDILATADKRQEQNDGLPRSCPESRAGGTLPVNRRSLRALLRLQQISRGAISDASNRPLDLNRGLRWLAFETSPGGDCRWSFIGTGSPEQRQKIAFFESGHRKTGPARAQVRKRIGGLPRFLRSPIDGGRPDCGSRIIASPRLWRSACQYALYRSG